MKACPLFRVLCADILYDPFNLKLQTLQEGAEGGEGFKIDPE